jgi:thiamine pyrophosphate-dependent acetolactate synthase large subunit-like protein
VEAQRLTEPDELIERVRESFARDRPILFDVPITRQTPDRLNYG